MMIRRNSVKLAVGGTIACALALGLGRCGSEDNGAYDRDVLSLTSAEVADMGTLEGDMMAGNVPAKQLAEQADTTSVTLVVNHFAYVPATGAYVREAVLTTSEGYQRTRLDTVTFRDAGGATQQYPSVLTTRSVEHTRRAFHAWSGGSADVRFHATTSFTTGTDTTMLRNGTLSGVVNGVEVASGEIDSVMARYSSGHWHFPESGYVYVDFPKWNYNITYTGNGSATASITNKDRDRTWTVTVQYN
jgi:hypothetical protein